MRSRAQSYNAEGGPAIDTFKALLLEDRDGAVQAGIQRLLPERLPAGEVTVRVSYSDLNYKDALAIQGKAKVVRSYPMIPGIDLAGVVAESSSPMYAPGDRVIATGFGLGEGHWGGFSELARLPAEWLVPLPARLTAEDAMGIGTAGLTAMLALMALEDRGMVPGERDFAVTGAAGGVGSMAVALFAARGYRVVASTGRPETHQYLRALGASEVVGRETFCPSTKPLQSERFGGAVDAVGGDTLGTLLTMMALGSGVAACGNAGGNQLNTTVLPFILRGVAVLGIDSAHAPLSRRIAAWARLAHDFPTHLLKTMVQVRPLEAVPVLAGEILQGKIRGRVVIDVGA